MKNSLYLFALCFLTIAFAPLVHAANTEEERAAAKAAWEKEKAYTQKLEERSADILRALKLPDRAAAERTQARVIGQYRALNAWQEKHEAKIKELRKAGTEEAKAQIATAYAERKKLREGFLAELAQDLTPEQIDLVKDKLTYNKLQVTYNAYCEMVPTLTEEQKAQILTWLKEAREEAIDGGSADEKSDIFNKYKGRINNYLSKQGIDMGKATKDWAERRKAETQKK